MAFALAIAGCGGRTSGITSRDQYVAEAASDRQTAEASQEGAPGATFDATNDQYVADSLNDTVTTADGPTEGSVPDGAADGGLDDAFGEASADAACGDLAAAARQQFNPIAQQNVACNEDSDCVWTPSDQGGWCVAPCGWLSNEAGLATVQSGANTLCKPFLAQGCAPFFLGCPYLGPYICAGGTCASYHFYLMPFPLPTFIHGVCTVLKVNYHPSAGSPNAPRDLVCSITASNGTLYSDPACTTPLTTGSLTIPSGSSSVAFGFTPTVAGTCLLDLLGPGQTYSLTVQ